jgi:hypothetical protein
MNHQRPLFAHPLPKVLAALLLLVALTLRAQPQQPTADQFVGTYKGTAKMGTGEMAVTLEIKFENEKFSGRALSGETEYKIASGKIEGGKLTIRFGTEADAAVLTLQKSGDKLVGDWIKGTQKGTVELNRVEAEPADSLTGEWDAVADAQGQAFPFTLSLKLDGEKVTGSSSSQLGTSTVSTGTWKDGKLAVILESGNGQIALIATMVEGKLSGDYDFAGQLSGKWVAIKKK